MRAAKAELEREAEEAGKPAPDPKEQRNFTDPDSAIMLNGEKAFVQGYNCQIAVDDSEHHIVVAESVSNQAADNHSCCRCWS